MAGVEFGYVADLPGGEEWWALRGQGAFHDGTRLAWPDRGWRSRRGVGAPELCDAAMP